MCKQLVIITDDGGSELKICLFTFLKTEIALLLKTATITITTTTTINTTTTTTTATAAIGFDDCLTNSFIMLSQSKLIQSNPIYCQYITASISKRNKPAAICITKELKTLNIHNKWHCSIDFRQSSIQTSRLPEI
ncbi:conserved hypothetical protein [Trichinella spiralis]|uniref:hypothetical protein n=1 Tax=Trichinella spiralis TaxID=6334 RepID=UPI0001EFBF71|nr:conserved hypothetical protein [Trichinella spiralis]